MDYLMIHDLLLAVLWGHPIKQKDKLIAEECYDFMKKHEIRALAANSVTMIAGQNKELSAKWKQVIYQTVYRYHQLVQIQNQLLKIYAQNEIPVVVVKGTSAAKYYPIPEYRTMGDIDLMTKPHSFDMCCELTINAGWKDTTSVSERKRNRHRVFEKNGVVLEIHQYFVVTENYENAVQFETLLGENILKDSFELPDMINGLVLIEHVQQHMQAGIGLRQIIDWMYFADRCLRGTNWNAFLLIAEKTGLRMMAEAITKVCCDYLGLDDHAVDFSNHVESETSQWLFEYILYCGNFGREKNDVRMETTGALQLLRHPVRMMTFLQNRGMENWGLVKQHPSLRHFAWAYQITRYMRNGLSSFRSLADVYRVVHENQIKDRVFSELGIRSVDSQPIVFVENENH